MKLTAAAPATAIAVLRPSTRASVPTGTPSMFSTETTQSRPALCQRSHGMKPYHPRRSRRSEGRKIERHAANTAQRRGQRTAT